jgi:hypothetical protein
MSPPGKKKPYGLGPAGLHQSQPTAPYSATRRQCVDALRRRRAACRRMPPLGCGCRDPWPCRCSDPPLTERQVDGWRDAALHVLGTDRIPLLPLEVRRALWRRGGADRALVQRLQDAGAGRA